MIKFAVIFLFGVVMATINTHYIDTVYLLNGDRSFITFFVIVASGILVCVSAFYITYRAAARF